MDPARPADLFGDTSFRQLGPDDPHQIGDYRLLALLGAGGMGRVYVGRSSGGRTVAVKVVRPELLEDPRFRERFQREVAAASRVGGAFTAPVIDGDTGANPPWFATGYIPGYSLGEAVARYGPVPELSLRVLAAGLAQALLAIHGAGVVHRDLKPSNVILTVDGPRVIDFGVARASDEGGLTTTGKLLGSPGYMAPEHITGAAPPAPAGDVFALGGVLAYAAMGYSAFGEGPTVPMLWRIVQEPPQLEAVPAGIRAVVAACLEKDPQRRPDPQQVLDMLGPVTAGEWLPPALLSAISRRAGELLNLEPPPPAERLTAAPGREPQSQVITRPATPTALMPDRRRRWLQFALAALVLCLVAASVAVGMLASGPESAPPADQSLPPAFAGTWKGEATMPLTSYQIELTLRSGPVGTEVGSSANVGSLSDSRCERAETLRTISGQAITLSARLLKGPLCSDDGAVTMLTMRPDGTLTYEESSFLGAMKGVLRKVN